MDPTKSIRMEMAASINEAPGDRGFLEEVYGKVWDTEELKGDFQVKSFLAPFVLVVRKSDGQPGILTFQHLPRFYFDFEELSNVNDHPR